MTSSRSVAAVLTLSFLATSVNAVVFHVDNRHASAADDNPGTVEKPCRHIQAAVDKVQPGDTITVHAGTYREYINWETPGLPGKRITLQSAPGETVVVKGSVVVDGWQKTTAKAAGLDGNFPGSNLWIKDDWTRENIYPADEPHLNGRHASFLQVATRWAFWKDAVLEGAGWLTFAYKRNELQEGRMYHDEKARTLTVWLPPGVDPNVNGIEVCVRAKLLSGPLQHVVVRGIQWRHANTRNLTNQSAVAVESNSLFEDNIVSWCDYIGMWVPGEKSVIRHNIFAYNGAAGIGGSGTAHLIEDNRVLYNNLDRHDTFNDAGGGKWVFLRNCTFRRHEAAYNMGPGLWLDIDNTDNVIESSYFHHNHGFGLFLEISPDNLVRNCVFAYNTEMPGGMRIKWEPHGNAPTQARIRHYVGHGDMGWGAYNSSCQGTRWLNNLFYANQNAGLVCEGGWRADGSVPNLQGDGPQDPEKKEKGWTTTRNLTILNNIFAGNGGVQLMIRSSRTDPDCVNNVSDYNLFNLPQGTEAGIGREGWSGARHNSFSDWREATGRDQHSLEANSELTLPAGGDYRPTLLSPAADRGTAVDDVTDDYLGHPRPVGKAYDIGPFERYSILVARAATGVPPGLTFRPVDIAAVLNRALADEQAEDGIGGWSDQGPACDLRNFAALLPTTALGRPTAGVIRRADVNFRIEYPVTILVLNPNNYRPGQLPGAATIPIMDKGDWLFFLHTTAWVGSWDYVIHFDDGTTETIEMRCPVNMRDWTAGGSASSFRFDEETSTAAAWTGTTESFPNVTIYRTAWENPKPDRRIDQIDMVGHKGVPGLLAVTLGRE
ncbi:MAG: right-handed parallel beta-helix repeat-containing protein [Lentisphaeria bacterium]|nr:right-handed parallel beta-helix repeat-containing protein [Lentisphaeria bacterium]